MLCLITLCLQLQKEWTPDHEEDLKVVWRWRPKRIEMYLTRTLLELLQRNLSLVLWLYLFQQSWNGENQELISKAQQWWKYVKGCWTTTRRWEYDGSVSRTSPQWDDVAVTIGHVFVRPSNPVNSRREKNPCELTAKKIYQMLYLNWILI